MHRAMVNHERGRSTARASAPPRAIRAPSRFTSRIETAERAQFPVESGRYQLIASYACPFAHRALLGRALLQLEKAMPLLVMEPAMDERGWRWPGAVPHRNLIDFYHCVDPGFRGRATVPILFDKNSETIVSDDSGLILRMTAEAFSSVSASPITLYPHALAREIDHLNRWLHHNVNDRVFKIASAENPERASLARHQLYSALYVLNERLAVSRYLFGGSVTESDLRLWPTLARFDIAYREHLNCGPRRLGDWPHLQHYFQRLLDIPEVASTLRVQDIVRHFEPDC